MLEFIRKLFDTADFPARWHCGNWSHALGWMHILSDVAIFGAYVAIPCVLAYFALRRRDVPFSPIVWLFAVFIFSCGFGHLVEATLFWHPWYRFSGVVKVITAVASWATVVALIPIVPRALALPKLAVDNKQLETEISERKHLENRLRVTFESAPTAMVMVNAEGRIIMVNAQLEAQFGYRRDELLDRQMELLVPARFRRQHPDLRKGFVMKPETRRMGAGRDLFGLRKDGTEFPVEIGLNPIQTDEGLCVLSAIVDITERKQTEEKIRLSEERLRLVVDSALDAVVTIGEDGVVTGWNPHAEAIFGWRREEAIGQKMAHLIIPETYREQHRSGLQRFLATGEGAVLNRRIELRAVRRNGVEFPIELAIAPMRIGQHFEFSAFVRDITERKQTEEAIQRYAGDLERSNRDLDLFAYSASHDLKAPLRAVDHLAQWITEDVGHLLPDDSRRDLNLMRQRLARMQRLLDDLLAYSRVGRSQHQAETVDTAQMVRDVVELLGLPGGFTVEIDAMPTLMTPKTPLEQVFRNLIANAVKHHHRMEGIIKVSATDKSPMVEFVVRDDGPGIAPEYHERIFKMFQTLKPRDQVEGSGMGLALVKKIVESQGGVVSLDSLPGHGAAFKFTWPRGA